jgi:protein tyrosine phosphatase (PTP) superfamily phosphohydrolase (DUF442 family)
VHTRRIKLLTAGIITTVTVAITAIVFGISVTRTGETAKQPPQAAERPEPQPIDGSSVEVKSFLPSFHRLNESYMRGAQPLRGGMSVLARAGVKTVVDLRSPYDYTEETKVAAERLGMIYHQVPMSVWNPPTDEEANQFLSIVTDESKGPFFVFCADGVNRVGEMSAIYRVMNDGWPLEQALKEMDDQGFNPYYYTLRNYVWTYARKFRPEAVPEGGRRLSPIEKWESKLNKGTSK